MATYTSATSGLFSAGATWVGGVKPPAGAGHKVVIATGHTVEYDEAGPNTYGDDTSTGIRVFGTLKFSRSVSTQLVVRGNLEINLAGTLDMGTEADPIPAGTTAILWLNDSATMGQQKYGLRGANVNWAGFRVWGEPKLGFTTMSAAASGDTDIVVQGDISTWQIGDILGFAPFQGVTAGNLLTNSGPRKISNIVGQTVTLEASIGSASHAGRGVWNLTRNVKIRSIQGNTFRSDIQLNTPAGLPANAVEVGPCELNLFGGGGSNTSAGMVNFNSGTGNTVAFIKKWNGPVFHTIWDVTGSTVTTLGTSGAGGLTCCISLVNTGAYTPVFDDSFVFHTQVGGQALFALGQSANGTFNNVIGRGFSRVANGFQGTGINNGLFNNGKFYALTASALAGLCLGATFNNCLFDGMNRVIDGGNSNAFTNFNTCSIGGVCGILDNNTSYVLDNGGIYTMLFDGCTFSEPNLLQRTGVRFNTIAEGTSLLFRNINNDVTNQQEVRRGGIVDRDNSMTNHGLSALRFNVLFAGVPVTKSIKISAASGETITVLGALRFNAAYLTATPPSVTISGLGATPVTFTAPATADAWHDFLLQITNPQAYAGQFTLTFTGQSAANSTAPYCWMDGVFVDDFVTLTRHYGYQFGVSPKVNIDIYITQTNAATVGAYTGIAVDHLNQVITLTETHSITELYDYCKWNLCQTANIGYADFLTTNDGKAFFSDYDLVVDGCLLTGNGDPSLSMELDEVTLINDGNVSIRVTDSTGTFVTIKISDLAIGSRVQLYDTNTSVELVNFIAAASTYTFYTKWTADHTVRMRTNLVSGLTANYPEEQFTTLTINGASFISSPNTDIIYEANAIDGSTVTEFSADYPNVQIDVSDPDNLTSVQRLYAWFRYNTMSVSGVQEFFGGIFAEDTVNYRIVTGVLDLKLDNTAPTPVVIVGARLYRDDGTTVIGGTGSIQMDPDKAYVASGGTLAAAVWDATLEGSLKAKEMLRVILAVNAGKTDIDDTTVTFRDVADTKDRVTAEMTGSKRTTITLDGS